MDIDNLKYGELHLTTHVSHYSSGNSDEGL